MGKGHKGRGNDPGWVVRTVRVPWALRTESKEEVVLRLSKPYAIEGDNDVCPDVIYPVYIGND